MRKININIWDDYLDGDSTYMYVEENKEDFSFSKQEKLLQFLLDYLNNNSIDDSIIFELLPEESECRPEIIIKNLSHDMREMLVGKLHNSDLSIYCNIYSES